MERLQPAEKEAIPLGIYEHYKSTAEEPRYYIVHQLRYHTETGEAFVIYDPLYDTEEEVKPPLRPLAMFAETVEHNGRQVPRFRYVGPNF